jgi:hypothetical protein
MAHKIWHYINNLTGAARGIRTTDPIITNDARGTKLQVVPCQSPQGYVESWRLGRYTWFDTYPGRGAKQNQRLSLFDQLQIRATLQLSLQLSHGR